jgi:hypothetical protein
MSADDSANVLLLLAVRSNSSAQVHGCVPVRHDSGLELSERITQSVPK